MHLTLATAHRGVRSSRPQSTPPRAAHSHTELVWKCLFALLRTAVQLLTQERASRNRSVCAAASAPSLGQSPAEQLRNHCRQAAGCLCAGAREASAGLELVG